MAIITEEPDSPKPQFRKPKPKSNPTSPSPGNPPPPPSNPTSSVAPATNPFHFWFYFTVFVSLITLFCILLSSSLSSHDPKTWFLNLPPVLRHHYSNGRTIKVQTAPNLPQIEVFCLQEGTANSDSHVLVLHGLGCSSFAFQNVVKFLGRKNVHAVAIDLPGSGFSDRSIAVLEESGCGKGFLGRLWEVYEDIKEKGLFWGFDQLVEQGYVNFEEGNKKESVKAIELGGEEMGRVLGQVVDSMKLAPVDLVLHDSALGLSANWISENVGLIRSVVILDGLASGTALPLWLLEVPLVREAVLGFRFVFERVVGMCCMKPVGGMEEAEVHRVLLKGRDGGRAVATMGKKLNTSFDLSEWSSLDGVKDLPIRVIWSGQWSDKWTTEGSRIAHAIPQATLVTHSGGRWPQEHNAEDVAESIYEFIYALPRITKVVGEEEEEPIHELNEAKSSDHDMDNHHHDGHGHAHAGYMDGYGLGHGWAM